MLGTRPSVLGAGWGQPATGTFKRMSSGSDAAWGHLESGGAGPAAPRTASRSLKGPWAPPRPGKWSDGSQTDLPDALFLSLAG